MKWKPVVTLIVLALVVTGVVVEVQWSRQAADVAEVDLSAGPWADDDRADDPLSRSLDRAHQPLAGEVVVLDAGHQLGNARHPRKINRQVPAGGFTKPCNTTGTATQGGYPEATFTWQVTRVLERRLERLGARVRLTRDSNRLDRWGPCVDVRGRAGNGSGGQRPADLKLSIHGDGSYAAGAHGFHVIAPTNRRPWTHDIYRPSKRLAVRTRAALRSSGLPVANYIAGGDGLDFRSDLGTLNLSDIPTVMVELGNMRNPVDARRMTSAAGRAAYAKALTRGVRGFLD